MQEFSKIFDNKTIAIIGPSPHLKRRKLGSYFDEFDLTIRVNEIIKNSDSQIDYGKKNDVIFITIPNASIKYYKKLFRNAEEELSKVKYFICPRHSLHVSPFHLQNFDKSKNIFKNFEKLNLNHKLLHIGDYENEKLETDIGFHPTTGTLSLAYLLNFNFKKLYVGGFSFYLTKNRYHNNKAKRMKTSGYNRKINKLPPGHKYLDEIIYLQKIFHNKSNVQGDEWFTKLILEKKFNLENYNKNSNFKINSI